MKTTQLSMTAPCCAVCDGTLRLRSDALNLFNVYWSCENCDNTFDRAGRLVLNVVLVERSDEKYGRKEAIA